MGGWELTGRDGVALVFVWLAEEELSFSGGRKLEHSTLVDKKGKRIKKTSSRELFCQSLTLASALLTADSEQVVLQRGGGGAQKPFGFFSLLHSYAESETMISFVTSIYMLDGSYHAIEKAALIAAIVLFEFPCSEVSSTL